MGSTIANVFLNNFKHLIHILIISKGVLAGRRSMFLNGGTDTNFYHYYW